MLLNAVWRVTRLSVRSAPVQSPVRYSPRPRRAGRYPSQLHRGGPGGRSGRCLHRESVILLMRSGQLRTGLAGQPRDEIRNLVQDYLDANPQTRAEIQGIRQPLADLRNRCGIDTVPAP